MDIVKCFQKDEQMQRVINFLKQGGQLTVFSPYVLKSDVFYDHEVNNRDFADNVDPLTDTSVEVGAFFIKGYEAGWMVEGAPCVDSMCSIKHNTDFITRAENTVKTISEIDRSNQSYNTTDEVVTYDDGISTSVFDCSYNALLVALKQAKLMCNVTDLGTLSLVAF